ncbi:hypothetical protein KDA11_02965 [Candidatus Saccharibacteria bacterium]|nr:hypothetical protein [Candidatus Saccharibacteria bacterium]
METLPKPPEMLGAQNTLAQLQELRRIEVKQQTINSVEHGMEQLLSGTLANLISESVDSGLALDIGIGRKDFAFSRVERTMLEVAAKTIGATIDDKSLSKHETGSHLSFTESDNGYLSFRYHQAEGNVLLSDELEKLRLDILRPFKKLGQKIKDGEQQALTDVVFDLDTNTDLTAVFLGLGNMSFKTSVPGVELLDFLTNQDTVKLRYPGDEIDKQDTRAGVYINESGNIQKILVDAGEGIYRGLYFEGNNLDPTLDTYRMGVELNEQEANLEVADGMTEIRTEAFIESDTSKDILNALGGVGLVLSKKFIDILTENHNTVNTRYGNGFAELLRETAKFVNNPNRSVQELFNGEVDAIKESIANLDINKITGGATKLLLGVLQQALMPRDSEASDVPVFDGRISIKAGSCKDSETKFVDAIIGSGINYAITKVGKALFVDKLNNGDKTSINLKPIIYKGVLLPIGCLFQRHIAKDGQVKYAFVRMTSFALPANEARDAFTWQYAVSRVAGIYANEDTLKKLKSMSSQ